METAPERSTVRVTIYNQPYTLLASDEAGEVETLAHTVDQLMTDIAQRAGNVNANQVAVLACLHMAERLRSIEREHAGLKERVDQKAKQFSILLDRVID